MLYRRTNQSSVFYSYEKLIEKFQKTLRASAAKCPEKRRNLRIGMIYREIV
jgi:hypothetical protein